MSDASSGIVEQAQARWATFPSKYRYSGDLKLHHYKPIERDFVASARLNYLHTLFLVRQSLIQNIAEPDTELLSICAETLNLTAKVAVMKGRLTNSGTGLIWKVRGERSSLIFCELTCGRSATTDCQQRA